MVLIKLQAEGLAGLGQLLAFLGLTASTETLITPNVYRALVRLNLFLFSI
jgi:hypothetical protein